MILGDWIPCPFFKTSGVSCDVTKGPLVNSNQHSPGWRWMPGMKHPAHILPGIAYLDHKPYMYDLVWFWCIMHGSNTMPDDDTSHLLVLFLWRLRGGLEPAAISRLLISSFTWSNIAGVNVDYFKIDRKKSDDIAKNDLEVLMVLPSLMLESWVCPQASTFTIRQHRYWYRHQFGGTLQHRTTKNGTHCLCTMDIASWLYDYIPVQREGRRSVLPFNDTNIDEQYNVLQFAKLKIVCLKQFFPPGIGHNWVVYIVWFIRILLRFHFLVSAA